MANPLRQTSAAVRRYLTCISLPWIKSNFLSFEIYIGEACSAQSYTDNHGRRYSPVGGVRKIVSVNKLNEHSGSHPLRSGTSLYSNSLCFAPRVSTVGDHSYPCIDYTNDVALFYRIGEISPASISCHVECVGWRVGEDVKGKAQNNYEPHADLLCQQAEGNFLERPSHFRCWMLHAIKPSFSARISEAFRDMIDPRLIVNLRRPTTFLGHLYRSTSPTNLAFHRHFPTISRHSDLPFVMGKTLRRLKMTASYKLNFLRVATEEGQP